MGEFFSTETPFEENGTKGGFHGELTLLERGEWKCTDTMSIRSTQREE